MHHQDIDDLLAGAGVLAGAYRDYDSQAARTRIAAKLAAHAPRPTTPAPPSVPPTVLVGRDGRELTFHEHAERDLRSLSTLVINEPTAAERLNQLIGTRRSEPYGGLVFGCLLHLTGHTDGAQFWWQFAAGAGHHTAAYCLYLHHAQRGELRDAEHWFDQAARLEATPDHPTPTPTPPPLPDYFLRLPWISQYLPPGTSDLPRPDHALRQAVDHLPAVRDEEYGPISLPTPDIADQLHDMVTTS